eukprot:m.241032 g.241032  ORF g.241032 m.241032 type:complete len:439 (-) comp13772_c0_seq1:198-1514(-)
MRVVARAPMLSSTNKIRVSKRLIDRFPREMVVCARTVSWPALLAIVALVGVASYHLGRASMGAPTPVVPGGAVDRDPGEQFEEAEGDEPVRPPKKAQPPKAQPPAKPAPKPQAVKKKKPAESAESAAQTAYVGCGRDQVDDIYYACRRAALLVGCGDLCNTSMPGEPGPKFRYFHKHINCRGLWANAAIDESLSEKQWPPPQMPPEILMRDFSHGGKINVFSGGHWVQRYAGGDALSNRWTKDELEGMKREAGAGSLGGTYGNRETNNLLTGLKTMDLINKTVLVIGSENPWVEASVLYAGAREVHTLEYGKIVSEHPQVKTFTPDEARERFLAGKQELFDAVVTFSSVEHSGLGRYGDALNPWGDIQTIARAWCVTKPGGQMLLAVPECGRPEIAYNAHRCYADDMWGTLATNWRMLEWTGDTGHRIHVFERQDNKD